jgi:apolipoprotein N-acyltransferase
MNVRLPGALVAALLLLAAVRVHPLFAWLVAAPLFAACRARRTSLFATAAIGVAFALAFAVPAHAPWLADAAQRYFDFAPPAAITIALALCLLCAVPFGVLVGVGLGSAARLPGVVLPVVSAAATWVACESLTRALVPYYPWIGLAATQADVERVVQLASIGGQALLSFVVAAFGCALALALQPEIVPAGTSTTSRAATRRQAIVVAAALAGGTVLYGQGRLASAPIASPDAPSGTTPSTACTVAAVDARIERGDLDPDTVLVRYASVTARAAATDPDAIVWPESALPRDPLATPELLARLRGIARDAGAILLAGGPRSSYDASWTARHHNTLFRIAADGPVAFYDKREAVPFAERWPRGFGTLPSSLALDTVAEGDGDALLPLGGCRAGVLICFEVERPRLAASAAASGADVLVVASNDAELPAPAIALEVAESRLRAVETGLPLLRAANRGTSVAIDRYGRATPAEDGVVALRVGAARPAAAVRFASWVVGACWLIVAATVLAMLRATACRA